MMTLALNWLHFFKRQAQKEDWSCKECENFPLFPVHFEFLFGAHMLGTVGRGLNMKFLYSSFVNECISENWKRRFRNQKNKLWLCMICQTINFLASPEALVLILVYYIPSNQPATLSDFSDFKVLKRPNICYIFEKHGIQGYRICHSRVSWMSWRSWIQDYKVFKGPNMCNFLNAGDMTFPCVMNPVKVIKVIKVMNVM